MAVGVRAEVGPPRGKEGCAYHASEEQKTLARSSSEAERRHVVMPFDRIGIRHQSYEEA